MLKINPIRAFAVASAITASTAVAAQNYMQKPNKILTESVIKADKNSRDEFILQTAKNNEISTTVNLTRSYSSTNPDFDKAVDFYNNKMTSSNRYSVTRKAYENIEDRLYKMEKEIDEAFQKCEAYQDIVIVPRWHYRFYPRFNDQLISFDIDELRTRTTKDMASLYKLRDDAARIFEKANGVEKHKEPEKIKYDVDEIALKHLGMSYKEFAEKYKDELEYCKQFTYADFKIANEEQLDIYYKAKAYATDMLNTTITEAHTTNWDIGEQKVDETIKTTSDMYIIDDFEYDGITKKGLAKFESGISFKAFEDALIEMYNKLKPTDENKENDKKPDDNKEDDKTSIDSTQQENNINKPIKRYINGVLKIFNPDGSVYNLNGQRIK